ncbi:squalene synthase HpnC [Aquabacterium sp. J223]|uniref:squalene synthase HpnC n=1 Tax=Aquabacterium sp. J223 TaxID=2898431 RepID=UPI0021AD68DC|nr:squalene synthase HpnC [Aquabacterium sp. J223]UUX97428.1 squalene synthase HpnC [Aquabacterium sp. J223]
MSVEHYENFPVASWLCPPALRPPITAIYWFARTADDIADEGDAPTDERLRLLGDYRRSLDRALAGEAESGAWPEVFGPLRRALAVHRLPAAPLHALLDAFEQDVRNPPYPDRAALLDYCRRSADPVGRLLLHLYGLDRPALLAQSDAICSALQLINFWQDLGRDLARGRCYLPLADCRRHGIEDPRRLPAEGDGPRSQALLRELCDWAEALMHQGAPLALQVPGRAGWELRLVVQGGLRVLARIRRMDHRCLGHRPTLGPRDALPVLAGALRMGTARPAR